MKKTLLALACAAILGQSFTAGAQEVQYYEDETQGYLFNPFKDNWFLTAEGGTNMLFTDNDQHRPWYDRFGYGASLWVGKWFSPLLGVRVGGDWYLSKGLTDLKGALGYLPDREPINGYYVQKFSRLGAVGHVMLNVTNWWCGYNPTRVYNFVLYGGVGGYWTFTHTFDSNLIPTGWKDAHDKEIALSFGFENRFRVSNHVDIVLDFRATLMDDISDQVERGWHRARFDVSGNLGFTYKFGNSVWHHPLVPVCQPTENCEPLRAALDVANARIADLEAQLEACLNRPAKVEYVEQQVVEEVGPLATIYFPINVSKLSAEDVQVLDAVAQVIKSTPDTKYVVTGWADNYTGNNEINIRLRTERSKAVAAQLVKAGVPESQITTEINNGSLCDLGEKFVALDRAATITVAK